MGYQNTVNVLLNEIEDLRELLLHVKEREEMSSLEIDLAKDKLRQIYDIFRMFENSSSHNEETQPEVTDNNTTPTDTVEQKEQKEQKPEEDIEPTVDKSPRTEAFEVRSMTESQAPVTEEEMAMTLGDKYKTLTDSLNDHMGKSKKKSDITAKYQSKPIKNIHTAIGLNEKFQFIKELFKGDSDLYNQTIDALNKASNFNEAYMYLNENFDWNMDSEPVKRILELTRRKFISQGDE